MSRRKQRKPQQLISDCDGSTASENGDTGDEDQPQVCTKCCAQFTDPAEFLTHQNTCCTDPPVMVILGSQENSRSNSSSSSSEVRPEGQDSPQIMDTEHSNPPDPGPSVPTDTSWGPERGREESSDHFLITTAGATSAGGGGGLILASPKLGATPLASESTPAPPPPPPPPPPPGAGSGHLNIPLILEELRVLQQRQIHQMQMTEQICRQVLLLGSLGQSVGATASPSELPGTGATTSSKTLLPLFSPIKPGQASKTLTPSSSSSSSSTSGTEVPKPAFFHLYHPLGAQHPFSSGGVGRSHKPTPTPTPSPALPATTDQLITSPHLAFPGTTGLLAAQCLGAARGLEAAASPGLLKPKNGSGELGYGEVMGPLEKPGGRHKCRFCAKVFGSDSALQIHLRSHTGERPYKCNVCGNRFTTRGNLKVHFHRHREKYPHVQMNPHPVPEHLDYVITGSGLPYGMSVPPEKAEEEATSGAAERKPLSASATALTATESLTLLSTTAGTATAPGLPTFNKFVLMKAVEPKNKADENTPPGSEGSAVAGAAETGTTTRMQLSKLVTSLPSWALLTNHFKTTGGFPFPYVLEPLGASPSETSKLQQLVEKIDRQGAVGAISTASGASTTSAPAVSSSTSSGPNQCVICLRVLSCPRALRLHYGQHGGERPFKCKVCGRAFSTRGNLRAHFVGHKASPAARAQNSCPICQKKFTNAVTLQQHVRMHLGGQIPNGGTMLPEGGVATKESGAEQSVPQAAGVFPQQQQQQPPQQQGSPEEELSEEEELEEEEEEEDITDEDSLAGRGSESGGEKAVSVRGDSEEASGPEDEATATAASGKEMDSGEKSAQQPSLPLPGNLEEPQPIERGSSEPEGGIEGGGQPEGNSSPTSVLSPEGEVASAVISEGPGVQEARRKELGESMSSSGGSSSSNKRSCGVCGQSCPSQAALEEHHRAHSKEGSLFTCSICKQGFPERATLKKHVLLAHHQVHLSTHVWNCSPARRGRRLSLEGPVPLLSGGQVKLQDFLSRDVPAQLVGVGPLSFWNQYTAFLSSGLASKPPGSSSTSTTTAALATPALFGPGTVAGKSTPALGSSEAKEKTTPFIFQPPASKTAPENPGRKEK
ncbi:sal-like protein 2 isoform X1 [Dromiciops gliroides]|uniref:sal-like protein 2 isoform X1 n=1 Tax=Dromiciops gliroides TaxID=33562 RepID=UPI001CC3F70E|nr:sal-like protein 2 isoform X1 [Dromiciops gliroides]